MDHADGDQLASNGEPLHVGRPNLGPREVFDAYVDRIYSSRWLTNDGPLVREFEAAISHRVGVRNCVR